jgi:hypothetical protein
MNPRKGIYMMKSYQAGKFFCRRIDINDSALLVY